MLPPRSKADKEPFLSNEKAMLILCISIAFLFWCFIKFSKTYTYTTFYELAYEVPSSYAMSSEAPTLLDVKMQSSGWTLLWHSFTQSNRIISLPLATNDQQYFYADAIKNMIERRASNKQKIIQFTPSQISINIKKELEKKVPIIAFTNINFEKGYQQNGKIKLIPDSVSITGPTNYLDEINQWYTDTLVNVALKETWSGQVGLQKPGVKFVTLSVPKVAFEIPVDQFTEKSMFLPIQIFNQQDSVSIFPKNIQTTFNVTLAQYESITAREFTLKADFNPEFTNTINQKVRIQLSKFPDYIQNVSLDIDSVEYYIIK